MSIYEKIGGAPSVSVAVDDFYQRVTSDPSLSSYFKGIDMDRLKAHQRSFIAAAIGGPDPYSGRNMAAAHAGLGVTPEAFGKVVEHLVATLTGLGVNEDTIGAIGSQLAPLEEQIVTSTPES
jgi:hemoglobin